MFGKFAATLAIGLALASAAPAETFEVQMLNKGEAGKMIFEPAFLRVAKGDSVKFVAANKGHNAEAIEGMIPDGAAVFKGKINEEIDVTFDVEGLYAVKCKPHYAMGMVMTIAVGDDVAVPDTFFEGRVPKKALERFEAQISGL
ncbi:pseudoazurin [Thalassovita taeanensis]|uniref:Pseudoazurin n=1 Tax=Thalassovita taeanensis TaxID=657014 RepID=A0A1H9GE95_9RHOB|nr:pseudoazurin [Thalassovita taeanensis]SEQ48397.1 pseudoazurin [Thalassovita taeanensis]